MNIFKADRYRGCLLGLAIGDALGTTLEFKAPGTFEPIKQPWPGQTPELVGGGPFRLKPGQWTDDTSMALCLAESLVEKGFDPYDQMTRYIKWYRQGYMSCNGRCFDIGVTTRQALETFERTGDPFSGPTDGLSSGNGSIMRLAPVPLYCHSITTDTITVLQCASASSRTTHGAPASVDACKYLASLISRALSGEGKQSLLNRSWDWPVELNVCPEIQQVIDGSWKESHNGTGYVVDSLASALWAFAMSSSFEEGCLMAVNLGNDADTTGAVYGQIAGAYYGEFGIPANWRYQLYAHEKIGRLAERLMKG